MLFMSEVVEVMKNMETHGSIILTEPILFTGNHFETTSRFIMLFFIPGAILFAAIKEKDFLLKVTYILSTSPFFNNTGN